MLLAAIQFSQGLAQERGRLLAEAYELIAEAGRLGAPQPMVDFNRGIVLARLGLWQEARRAYGKSLDGDAVSSWADEARQRIRDLELLEREQITDSSTRRPPGWIVAASCEQLFEHSIDFTLGEWLVAAELGDGTRVETLQQEVSEAGAEARRRCDDETLCLLAAEMKDSPSSKVPVWRDLLAGKQRYDGWFEQDRARESFRGMLAANPTGILRGWAEYWLIGLDIQQERYRGLEGRIERQLRQLAGSQQPLLRGRLFWALGLAHIRQNRNGPSHTAYTAGLSVLENAGYEATAAAVRVLLAENLAAMGFETQAWTERVRAMHDLRRAPGASSLRNVSLHNAWITGAGDAAQAGKAALAEALANEALARAVEREDRAAEAEVLVWMARSLSFLDRGGAAERLRQATRVASRLPENDQDRLYQLCDVELASLEAEPTAAHAAVRLARTREICPQARRAIFAAGSWRLEARIRQAGGDLFVAQATLDRALESVRLALDDDDAGRRESVWEESQRVFELGIAIALERGDPKRALFLLEEARAPVAFSNASLQQELTSWRALVMEEATETAGEAILVLGALDDDVVWWLLRPNGDDAWGRRVGARGALGGAMGRDYWSSGDTRRKAFEALLAPAAERLSAGERLIVVPDRELFVVPYAALVDPRTDAALIESRDLGLRISLRHAIARRPDTEPAPARLLFVANPSGDPRFLAPLDGAELEIAEAAAVWGDRSTSLVGRDATLAAARPWLDTSSIVHLAMHAVRGLNPGDVSLAFAADGGLADRGAAELVPLSSVVTATTRLLVLSACATGRLGFERTAVAWPLQSRVASRAVAVVATLWPIDDRTTAPFVAFFHQRLATGRRVSVALAEAQRAWIRHHPESVDWAAFQALGDARFEPVDRRDAAPPSRDPQP